MYLECLKKNYTIITLTLPIFELHQPNVLFNVILLQINDYLLFYIPRAHVLGYWKFHTFC